VKLEEKRGGVQKGGKEMQSNWDIPFRKAVDAQGDEKFKKNSRRERGEKGVSWGGNRRCKKVISESKEGGR